MLLYLPADLWQRCELDVTDGSCMPYVESSALKIYISGQVTELRVVECDGDETVIDLADTSYVIAEDDNGNVYTYITDIPIDENLTCFALSVTVDGTEYFTHCYIRPSCYTGRKYQHIGSEFNKYDCLNRWYGIPRNVIAGNALLQFTNSTYIWGTFHDGATNFEFTDFKTCTITKTKALKSHDLQALSIPPYVVPMVEAILGRGIVTINGEQYAVQNGTHFERIIGSCRSQWDMSIKMTDCGCEINHECDLGLVVEGSCSLDLTVQCITDFTTSATTGTAQINRSGNTVTFTFSDTPSAAAFFDTLTCAYNYHSLLIYFTGGILEFFGYFISGITLDGLDVYFDYTFALPASQVCPLDFTYYATDETFPDETTIGSQQIIAVCSGLALLYTATVTGSTSPSITWVSNAPSFITISDTQIKIPITRTLMDGFSDISVDVTAISEECGTQTASVDINIDPEVNMRFVAADGAFVWDPGISRDITINENSYLVNDTVASIAWQVLNVGAGYSGGSPTTGTGSSFTLLNVGLDDDFIIELTVTTASGLVSVANMLFGQNGEIPDQDVIIRAFFLAVTNAGTELTFVTTYSIPVNTYVYPVIADEVGLDADNSTTYEQVCDAALIPCNFIHDYLGAGFYTGVISVSILDSVPPPPGADTYTGFGFGFVRCQYALSLT